MRAFSKLNRINDTNDTTTKKLLISAIRMKYPLNSMLGNIRTGWAYTPAPGLSMNTTDTRDANACEPSDIKMNIAAKAGIRQNLSDGSSLM